MTSERGCFERVYRREWGLIRTRNISVIDSENAADKTAGATVPY